MSDIELSQTHTAKFLYFAMIGFQFEREKFEIVDTEQKPIASIQKVTSHPDIFTLAKVLEEPKQLSLVERYAGIVTHELIVPNIADKEQDTAHLAYNIIACLRVASTAEGLVPIMLDRSLSELRSLEKRAVNVYVLEDYPKAKKSRNPAPITQEDIDWVGNNLQAFKELRKNSTFDVAVDSYCSYGQASNARLTVASLWTGIESLFNVDRELSFRISLYISVLTKNTRDKQLKRFREVKKLYETRSTVVHGRKISETALMDHIRSTSLILSHLIMIVVENKKLFSNNEIEEIIFLSDLFRTKIQGRE